MSRQLYADLGVLAFLGMGCVLAAGIVAIVWARAVGRLVLSRWLAGALLAGAALYVILLFGVGLLTKDAVLAPPEEKFFCEVDCHLAYSVTAARQLPALGERRARGEFRLITLRTRFDEHSISPHRGNGPLSPNPRRVRLLDAGGRAYAPLPEADSALDAAGIHSTPLTQELRPGEAYTTVLVFDVPPDIEAPRLLLTEDVWVNRIVIGHEESPLHGKTYLALPATTDTALR